LIAIGRDGLVPGAEYARNFDGLSFAADLQGALLLSYAEAVCKAVGVPPSNVVRAQYFLTDMRDFAGISAAWTRRYGKRPHPFSSVQVPAPFPAAGACAIGDFWIYAGRFCSPHEPAQRATCGTPD